MSKWSIGDDPRKSRNALFSTRNQNQNKKNQNNKETELLAEPTIAELLSPSRPKLKMLTVKGFCLPLRLWCLLHRLVRSKYCQVSKVGLFRVTRSPTFPFSLCAWMSKHDCGEQMRRRSLKGSGVEREREGDARLSVCNNKTTKMHTIMAFHNDREFHGPVV